MLPALAALAIALLDASGAVASAADRIRVLGPQGVNLWRLEQKARQSTPVIVAQEEANQFAITNKAEFPPQWFEQPLDHFDDSVGDTFQQRYWVNTRHYKPGVGGPVIVLDGGETSGEVRVWFRCL